MSVPSFEFTGGGASRREQNTPWPHSPVVVVAKQASADKMVRFHAEMPSGRDVTFEMGNLTKGWPCAFDAIDDAERVVNGTAFWARP